MEIADYILDKKRDLNISLCLTGVIPFLVFVYLMVNRIATFKVFVGEIGFIMLFTIIVFLLGMAVGKRLLLSLITELVEKNRLATVTETVLTLSHEINNPLLTISGTLELLKCDIEENKLPPKLGDRLNTIRDNFERIRQVTSKMLNLSKPATETVYGSLKMIDLDKSS